MFKEQSGSQVKSKGDANKCEDMSDHDTIQKSDKGKRSIESVKVDKLYHMDQFLQDVKSKVQSLKSSSEKVKRGSKQDFEAAMGIYLGKRDPQTQEVLDEEDIEASILGSDYDDIDQFTAYNDPKRSADYYETVTSRYMDSFALASENSAVNEKPDSLGDATQGLMDVADDEFAAFVKFAETPTVSTGNARGYHLIIGAKALLDFGRSRPLTAGSIASCLDFFEHDPSFDYKAVWKYIKAFPYFINYISSVSFVNDINRGFREQLDKIYEFHVRQARLDPNLRLAEQQGRLDKIMDQCKALPEYKALSQAMFKVNPFAGFHFVWSLEGLDKFIRTQDVKYLHFHLIALRKDGGEIRTERVSKVIKTVGDYFNKALGAGTVSIGGVRSKNQMVYIGKEKVLVGVSFSMEDHGLVVTSEMDVYNYSLLYQYGQHHFEKIFGALTNHFSSISTYLGVSCYHCDMIGLDDKLQYCKHWGFDETVLRHLKVNSVEPFVSMFKMPGKSLDVVFDDWLTAQNENAAACSDRIKVMANYRGVLLTKAFKVLGLSDDDTIVIMSSLTAVFYNFTHCEKHAQFYAKLRHWMGVNRYLADNWRHLLILGGPGGVGKSSLAELLQAGLGLMPATTKLQKGSDIGRDPYNPLRLVRFYDEVHQGKSCGGRTSNRGANIFFDFQSVESNQTTLYRANAARKAREWIVAASADIYGFPDYQQFVRWNGERDSTQDAYIDWKRQAERRFTVLTIDDVQMFQLPYCRLFWGSNSYVRGSGTNIFVEKLGVPSLGKYDLFT